MEEIIADPDQFWEGTYHLYECFLLAVLTIFFLSDTDVKSLQFYY